MTRLGGKVALVTGGRGGVGRAICQRFEAEGAVVYAADLSPAGSLGDSHDGSNVSRFIELDITSETSTVSAMGVVGEEHGRLDVLVNAAGIEIEDTIEGGSSTEGCQRRYSRCGSDRLTSV